MAGAIESVDLSPLSSRALPAEWFSEACLVIPDPAPVLAAFGFASSAELYGLLPAVRQGGVQTAPSGAIQDPAGSAVGGDFAGAGGASGAIYQHFNRLPDRADHLARIPDMPAGAAVFNASQGAGRRVLHTHSPLLQRYDPSKNDDRGEALTQIANAYYNAMVAFNARSPDLGRHGQLLNLVPISGGIFCGAFRNARSDWNPGTRHLDPSYTLAAVLLALAQLKTAGSTAPKTTIYYFDEKVCKTAAHEVARLQN